MTEKRKISELTEVTTLSDDDELVFVQYSEPTPVLSSSTGITEFPNVSGGDRLDTTVTWSAIPGVVSFKIMVGTHYSRPDQREHTETISGDSTSYTIPSEFINTPSGDTMSEYLFIYAVATYEDGSTDILHNTATNAIALHTGFNGWTLWGKVQRNINKSAQKIHLDPDTRYIDAVEIQFVNNRNVQTGIKTVSNPETVSYSSTTEKYRYRVQVTPEKWFENSSDYIKDSILQDLTSPTETYWSAWTQYYDA